MGKRKKLIRYIGNELYPLIRKHAALQFGFDRPWRGRRHAHSLSSYKIFYNLQ